MEKRRLTPSTMTTVLVLGSLLLSGLNHVPAEEFLPVIVGEDEAEKRIERQIDRLLKSGNASAEISATARRWLQKNEELIPWYEHAKPASLEEIEDLNKALGSPAPRTLITDQLKLEFLAVQEAGIDARQKTDLLRSFLGNIARNQPTLDRWHRVYATVYNDKKAPKSIQATAFVSSLVESIAYHDGYQLKELLDHPSCSDLVNDDVEKAATQMIRHDTSSPGELVKLIENQTKGEMGRGNLLVSRAAFNQLLSLGAFDQAKKVATTAKDWKFEKGIEENGPRMSKGFLGAIEMGEKIHPLHKKLSALVLKGTTQEQRLGKKELPHASDLFDLGLLDRDTRLAILLRRIDAGDFHSEDLYFWSQVVDALKPSKKTTELILELIGEGGAIAEPMGDEILDEVLTLGSGSLDLDDTELRHRYFKMTDRWDDPKKFPSTSASLRAREALMSLRGGEKRDMDQIFSEIEHPGNAEYRLRLRLDRHLATGNRKAIGNLLDEAKEEQLKGAMLLGGAIRGATLLGRKDVAKELREELPTALRQQLFAHWMSPSMWTGRIFDLAEVSGKPNLVPRAWLDDSIKATGNRFDRLSLQIRWHRLHGNHQEVIKASDQFLEAYPTYYDFYFYRGMAYAETGAKAKALKDLELYAKYSANEPSYRTAQETISVLRKELKKKALPSDA